MQLLADKGRNLIMRKKRIVNLLDKSTYPTVETLCYANNEDRLFDFYLNLDGVGDGASGNAAGDVAESETRGHLCNTAPTTLQNHSHENPENIQEVGGYDTLEILIYGQWQSEQFSHLTKSLNQVKKRLTGSSCQIEGEILEIAGEEVKVWPSGVRRGLYCSWCFTWQAMNFAIVNSEKSDKSRYGIHLKIGSIACLELGGEACWEHAKQFLTKLGFKIEGNCVSRADMCVDLPGVSTHEMASDYSSFKFISRSRKSAEYSEGYQRTGFSRGSGKRIMIRVYDKLKELGLSIESLTKLKILIEKRWGGKIPKYATRVEFQLRRDAIKDFEVDSIEDLFNKAAEICSWLTHKWFRMTEEVPDRNHTDRAVTNSTWAKVQQYFAQAFGQTDPEKVKRQPRRIILTELDPLKRQITGCLTSVAACGGHLFSTIEELANFAKDIVTVGGTKLIQEITEKRSLQETALPGLRANRPEIKVKGQPCAVLAEFGACRREV